MIFNDFGMQNRRGIRCLRSSDQKTAKIIEHIEKQCSKHVQTAFQPSVQNNVQQKRPNKCPNKCPAKCSTKMFQEMSSNKCQTNVLTKASKQMSKNCPKNDQMLVKIWSKSKQINKIDVFETVFSFGPGGDTGGYQDKKIGLKRKGLTFLRFFKGKLMENIRTN